MMNPQMPAVKKEIAILPNQKMPGMDARTQLKDFAWAVASGLHCI